MKRGEIMILTNVWVVTDGQQNYFEGCRESETSGRQISIFKPLSSRTRTYKTKRSASAAVRMASSCYESPYIKAEFIECAKVEDVPEEPKPDKDALEKVPEEERSGWLPLDRLCGKLPAMMRKGNRYAVVLADKEYYFLPSDERFAWKRYFKECEKFVLDRIENRAKK